MVPFSAGATGWKESKNKLYLLALCPWRKCHQVPAYPHPPICPKVSHTLSYIIHVIFKLLPLCYYLQWVSWALPGWCLCFSQPSSSPGYKPCWFSKPDVYGGSPSWFTSTGLRSPMWVLDTLFLRSDLGGCEIPLVWVGHLGYEFWLDCIPAPPVCLDNCLFFISLAVEKLFC